MIIEALIKSKINDYLQHRREPNVIYVTDLVRCPLKYIYEQKYTEIALAQQYSPSAILGTLVHKGLESLNLLEDYEVKTEIEGQKVIDVNERSVTIKGRLDIMLKNKITSDTIIVEIKAARKDLGLPHPHHVLQLRLYQWLFNVNKGILLYITPDRLTEYSINEPISDDEVRQLVYDLINVAKAPKYSWECKYCEYNIVCPNKKT